MLTFLRPIQSLFKSIKPILKVPIWVNTCWKTRSMS